MSDRIVRLIELLREERFLEYKQTVAWDLIKDKVVKTAMGMANIPDGGTIIIGMTKNGNTYAADGLLATDFSTYKVDDIQAYINKFADPFVRVQTTCLKYLTKDFIAIDITEFDEFPVVCCRNGNDIREGAVYTRANRIPETVVISSQTEMREILERATDKGVRKFLQRAHRAGMLAGTAIVTDDDKFSAQLGGL